MRKLNLIYATFLIIECQSCVYDKMVHFSDEDLQWMDAYSVGDTVLFQSQRGNVDTLVIRTKNIYDTYNPFYFWTFPPNEFHAYANYGFVIKSHEDSINGGLGLDKIGINFLNINSHLNHRYSYSLEHPKILKKSNYWIDGFTYYNSIKFDDGNSRYSKYWQNLENKIECYIISPIHGLVYYKYDNGEYFIKQSR